MLVLPLVGVSCNQMGPAAVRSAGVNYNKALQFTSDQQLLLNIVRLRYRDNPTFLETTSVTTSYSLTSKLTSPFSLQKVGASTELDLRTVTPNLELGMDEKPTVTYQPLRGESFVKQVLTPIPGRTLLLLYHSGWSMERLLRLLVYRMNDVMNAPSASGPTPDLAPQYESFLTLAQTLRSLQRQDKVFLAGTMGPDKELQLCLGIQPEALEDPEVNSVRKLLGLREGGKSYLLTTDIGARRDPDKILIGTRSLMGVLFFLGHGIEVPEAHEADGVVTRTLDKEGKPFDWNNVMNNLFHVKSGAGGSAAVGVSYRGRTFFIDDADLTSKSTFMVLSQILALQSGDAKSLAPALTIGVGG
ncbi:MAG: hypothetical protein HYZ53_22640 [Planctomycetes bacterium]|nr:hypothetical protein [Planctomycetota bacterium]